MYYNRGDPAEPFCVDFGEKTTTLVASAVETYGHWIFCADDGGDPKAWLSPVDASDMEVDVYLDESKVVVRAR